MIPVAEQQEPADFEVRVRQPGARFLAQQQGHVTSWEDREYWRRALPDLHVAYRGVCAYCAHWISDSQGAVTVDHYVPRSADNALAYEWGNYRLASRTMNTNKREFRDVLDPFDIQAGWFELDFPSVQVKPGDQAPAHIFHEVRATIARLKLNDEVHVKSRLRWVRDYRDGHISLDYLSRRAPFIAREIERQGHVDDMLRIMPP